MKEFLNDIIVPLGVLSTLIVTIINNDYTRRNLKTTKHIDTITSEVIANIYFTLDKYLRESQDISDDIKSWQGNNEQDSAWVYLSFKKIDKLIEKHYD